MCISRSLIKITKQHYLILNKVVNLLVLYSLLLKISDVLDEDLAKEIAFDEVPFKEINRVLLEWYEDGVTDYLVQLDLQVLNEIGEMA